MQMFYCKFILQLQIYLAYSDSFYPPLPMEEGGLAEYVCTHPCFVVGLQSKEDHGRVRVTACFPTVLLWESLGRGFKEFPLLCFRAAPRLVCPVRTDLYSTDEQMWLP